MQKRLLFIACLLLAICNKIVAADGVDQITISDFSMYPGDTKEVSVVLTNTDTYVGFQFDLYLPAGVTVESFSGSNRLPSGTTPQMAQQTDGSYRFVAAALSGNTITGSGGAIMTLTLKSSVDMAADSYPSYLRNVKISKADGSGVVIAEQPFTVTIEERPQVATPTLFRDGRYFALTTETEGATIYYAVVEAGAGTVTPDYQTYSDADTHMLNGASTIYAYATRTDYNNSETASFTVSLENMTAKVPSGFAYADGKVTLTVPDSCRVYYTTDDTVELSETTGTLYEDGIPVTSNVTVRAISVRDFWYNSAVASYQVNAFKVADVQFAQNGNVVTLSTATEDATIFYTLSNDGSGEQQYTAPLIMTDDCTIEAYATREGYTQSDKTTFEFHAGGVTCSNPVFARNENVITITSQTDSVSIYYTIDGTDPTEQSTLYSEAITVDRNMTIKAIAMRENYYPSQIETFEVDWFKVANVEFAANGKLITLSTSTADATIHYTLSTSEAGEQIYSAPIEMTGDCTISAYATRTGYTQSDASTYNFEAATVTVAIPTFAQEGSVVTISTTTSGASIYYTTDGTTPTTSSTLYENGVSVNSNVTIKAIAIRDNWFSSAVAEYNVTSFKVSDVQFTQNGNVVTLSTATENATIFYTLSNNGSGEQQYTGPLTMTGDCTIEAYATREGYTQSDKTTFEFHAGGVTCSNPVFARNENVITITSQTDSVSIYYTIDGTDPTEQSTLYSEAITVDHNMTIKAIAMRENYYPSQIETFEVDWFKVANVEFAANGKLITLSTSTAGATIHYTLSTSEAGEQIYSAPIEMTGDCTISAYATRTGYTQSDATTYNFEAATVTVAIPTFAQEGSVVTISTTTSGASIYYTTDGTTPTTSSTLYENGVSVNSNVTIKAIAIRDNWFSSAVAEYNVTSFKVSDVQFTQNGNVVTLSTATENATIFYTLSNKGNGEQQYTAPLIMTGDCTIEAYATREGYTQSDATSYNFEAATVTVAMPTFNRTGNTVTINTVTEDATIYYTTDGSDPTTASTAYTDGITVTQNTTIKAIAVRTNWFNSAIATYQVNDFKVANVEFAAAGNQITLTCATADAAIFYHLSTETDVTAFHSYTAPLNMTSDCTIEAYATRTGYTTSDTTKYEFHADGVTVATPHFARNGNKVGISTTTEQATIYYTMDGTTPTDASTVYSDSITVTRNCVISAIAMRQNYYTSQVATFEVNWFKVANVEFAANGNIITMSCATPGSTIHYTLSNITEAGEQTYTEPLVLTENCTITAYATLEGYNDSEMTNYVFAASGVTLEAPTFAWSGDNLIISHTDADAQIYYSLTTGSTEGTANPASEEPTTLYTGPIEIKANATIKALARKTGMIDSQLSTLVYDYDAWQDLLSAMSFGRDVLTKVEGSPKVQKSMTDELEALIASAQGDYEARTMPSVEVHEEADKIRTLANDIMEQFETPDPVALPVIAYNGRYVTLTCETAGASIYYTTNGTAASTDATLYDGVFAFSGTGVIRAIATDGTTVSDEATYEVSANFDGQTVTIAEGGDLNQAFEWCGRAEAAKTLTAIIWNSTTALTNADLRDFSNPNLLLYVKELSLAPSSIQNTIVDGVARNIVLSDITSGNGDFYCPQAFTAEHISYTRSFDQETEVNVSRGWETIALPFTVQTITHEINGALRPFGSTASGRPFWLRQLSGTGLDRATEIVANRPYLISMPNNSREYSEEYNQGGRVTFAASNVTISVTSPETSNTTEGTISLVPTFSHVAQSADIYTLNVGEPRGGNQEGSVFEQDYRDVRPFEAYTRHNGSAGGARFISITDLEDMETLGIDNVMAEQMKDGRWYTLDGRRLEGKPTMKGVYLTNGRKVIIK